MEFLPPLLLLICMKAELGDANQDHVLCKRLGRASPKSLILHGRNPVSVMELFVGTKLLSRLQYKTEP